MYFHLSISFLNRSKFNSHPFVPVFAPINSTHSVLSVCQNCSKSIAISSNSIPFIIHYNIVLVVPFTNFRQRMHSFKRIRSNSDTFCSNVIFQPSTWSMGKWLPPDLSYITLSETMCLRCPFIRAYVLLIVFLKHYTLFKKCTI